MPANLEYSTKRFQTAIYLHATGLLKYLRTEPHADGKVRFTFHDPEDKGRDLELGYERGAQCAARDIFASQLFLRREMEHCKFLSYGDKENDYARR